MKRIVILGTGGNCIDILDTILDINSSHGEPVYDCIGFLDDNQEKWNKSIHGVKVLGPLRHARDMRDVLFVFGIGSVSNFWTRGEILSATGIEDERFETIIHPTASVSRMASVGQGAIIFQNSTITADAAIGRHVYILPNSVISHDDQVGDFTCIAGSVCISGNVRVGRGCYLGANSILRDGITVGDHCLIGTGSVVLADVAENSVVVGNPARFLRNTTA